MEFEWLRMNTKSSAYLVDDVEKTVDEDGQKIDCIVPVETRENAMHAPVVDGAKVYVHRSVRRG